jgi:hypothetical protein
VTTTLVIHRDIAETIRRQIGTDAWLAVSGRDSKFWANDDGDAVFCFRFGSRYGLANWCEITYKRGSDDYSIWAYKIRRNGKAQAIAQYDNVYFDSLGFLIRDINQEAELS